MIASGDLPDIIIGPGRYQGGVTAGVNMRGEYFSKIIMGQLELDAYDEFLTAAKEQGMDEFVALWQAALDRYNAR